MQFLGNKAKRLLVPYIFIAAVWVAPIHVYYYGTDELVSKYVLGTAPSQLWFLLMLFWVFAIFWLISDFINKKPLIGGVIVCILFCVGFVTPNIYCFSRGVQFLLFFYIGFLIRKNGLGNKFFYRIPSLIYITVDIGLFVICELVGCREGTVFKILSLGCSPLLHIIGAISAFVLLQRFVNHFIRDNKVIEFFSKHSMVIYLVHQQLIYFTIGWFNGIVPPVILVLINFVFSLSVSTVFSMLMHKTKVTRFLVGCK